MLEKAPRKREFFWDAGSDAVRLRTNHKIGFRRISDSLKAAGRDFVELISKMLQWEPEQRISMEEIKKLRFFEGV